jgi:phosphatidylserine decarboxylase
MKHSGKARKAAFNLIVATLVMLVVVTTAAIIGTILAVSLVPFLVIVFGLLWIAFSLFTLYFFRDPTPRVPTTPNLVVAPAHGKVDAIDTVTEPQFMEGECQRVSIFLSVFNVHVQNAPVSGRLGFFKYTLGQFLNAMKAESAQHNENVLLGFEASDPPGQRIGLRLIAGVIARRIVPFVQVGDVVARGDRISLIQFGSRADLYLPLSAKLQVKLGDSVVGGETILATFD